MRSSKKRDGKQQILPVLAASVASVAKNRNGPTGTVPLVFLSRYARFDNRRYKRNLSTSAQTAATGTRLSVFVDTRQAKPKDQQPVAFFEAADIYPPTVM